MFSVVSKSFLQIDFKKPIILHYLAAIKKTYTLIQQRAKALNNNAVLLKEDNK